MANDQPEAGISPERKFLHDLATPLMIARTMIKKTIAELKPHENEEYVVNSLRRLESALKAMESMEKLHADHKATLFKIDAA